MSSSTFLKQVVSGIRLSAKRSQLQFRKSTSSMSKRTAGEDGEDNTEIPDEVEYSIQVVTGDVPAATTGANVFITLYGKGNATSGFVMLDDEKCAKPGFKFVRGQTDTFTVKSAYLENIERIRIGHDGTGTGAGWYLKTVVVSDPITHSEFEFVGERWLSTDEGDRQLVTDIDVSHEYSLSGSDFQHDACETFQIESDSANNYPTVTAKDFAPKVFRNIREMYGIHTKDYTKSWTLPDNKLTAEEGAGRSGSLFLISSDNKYMLKTIPHDEVHTLMNCLHNYYQHLADFRTSLIMKIFGVMHFSCKGHDVYVMIFTNVCYYQHGEMNATYDLKGRVPKPGKALQNTAKMGTSYIFKDKDLDRKFCIRLDQKSDFFTQLNRDIEFFRLNNLMDYSLLIGVASLSSDNVEDFPEWQYVARSSPEKKEIYFIGFIDCLTNYGLRKKTAHFFKTAVWTPNTLSTIDATSYAERIKYYLFDILDASGDEPRSIYPASRTASNGLGGDDSLLMKKQISFLESKVHHLELQLDSCIRTMTDILKEKNIDIPRELATQNVIIESKSSPFINGNSATRLNVNY
eukprot:CFRG7821T1